MLCKQFGYPPAYGGAFGNPVYRESLAAALLEEVPLPVKAATDALHIAVAAVNGVEYLLT